MSQVTTTIPRTTGGTTATECFTGFVVLDPQQLIGAINGQLFREDFVIRISQVVGPAGGPVSLTQVNQQFATVCGRFTDGVFRVTLVIPVVRPFPAPSPVIDTRLLLLLLIISLLSQPGAVGLGRGLGIAGLGGLQGLLGTGLAGLNLSSLLGGAGLSGANLTGL